MNKQVKIDMDFHFTLWGDSKVIRIYKEKTDAIIEFDSKLNNFLSFKLDSDLNEYFDNMDIVILFTDQIFDLSVVDKVYRRINRYYDKENTIIFTIHHMEGIIYDCNIFINLERTSVAYTIVGEDINELYNEFLEIIKSYISSYIGDKIVNKLNKKCKPNKTKHIDYINFYTNLEICNNLIDIDMNLSNDYTESVIKNIYFHKDAIKELNKFNNKLNSCLIDKVKISTDEINLVYKINKNNINKILEQLRDLALLCYLEDTRKYNIYFIANENQLDKLQSSSIEDNKLLAKLNVCVCDSIYYFITNILGEFEYANNEEYDSINIRLNMKG